MSSLLEKFLIVFQSNSADVVKGNKEIERTSNEATRALNKQGEATQAAGAGFTKMIEGVAGALAGAVTFNAIKNGIVDVNNLNAALSRTATITGQNIKELQALGNFAQSAGGSSQTAINDAANFTSNMARNGIKGGSYTSFLNNLRKDIEGENDTVKLQKIEATHMVNDAGIINRLMGPKSEWDEYYKKASDIANITKEIGKNAEKTNAALSQAEQTRNNVATQGADAMNGTLQKALDWDSKNLGGFGAPAAGVAASGASALGGWKAVKWARGLFGGGAAAAGAGEAATAGGAAAIDWAMLGGTGAAGSAAGAGIGATAGVAALALAPGALLGYYHKDVSGGIDSWLHGDADAKRKAKFQSWGAGDRTGPLVGGSGDLQFWMSQGYSKEQAYGIMANIQAESGGRANARGDSGGAHGLFQWQNTRGNGFRRDMIKAGTGIDVSTAGREDQLRAAAWEMKNGKTGFDDATFRKLGSADAAAAYFSRTFERPADAAGEAYKRGRSALAMIDKAGPMGGTATARNTEVTIGDITINTQATDAAGVAADLKENLTSILRSIQGNNDDGVEA